MINVNFFGSPGTGKSTNASGVFHKMKKDGFKVEMVPEYAKGLVYGEDFVKLSDQIMILANQHHPQFILENQVDYVIHDGPFLLGVVYLQENSHIPYKEFKKMVIKMFKSYNNINIFLKRSEYHPYQEYGRNQTIEESDEIGEKIKALLDKIGEPYYEIEVSKNTVKDVIKIIKDFK